MPVPGFNKANQCPKDKGHSVFLQAQGKRSLENVMFNMAAIELNEPIEPINIVHFLAIFAILLTGGHIQQVFLTSLFS